MNADKNLINRIVDEDTNLLMEEVIHNGNLNMQDSRVQEALMKTAGFKENLIGILKKEKEEAKKKE